MRAIWAHSEQHLHSLEQVVMYQSRSPTQMQGFVWLHKGCLSIQPCNPVGHTTRTLCLGGGREEGGGRSEGGGGAWGYSNIPRQIGKKVLSAIYVWAPFNPIDAFESCESPLSLEQTIFTHLGASRHMEYVSDLPNDKYGSNNDAKQR